MDTKKEEPICYCTGTTESQIKRLVARNITSLEGIVEQTGVTTGCAGCEYDVIQLIEQLTRSENAE